MASKVTVKDKFDAAVKAIASLPSDGPFQPSNELKLKMYGCYKQATVGPCNVPRPSFWDVVNKAKWDAWSALGPMDKEEAMKGYVEEIGKFVEMMPQNEAVRDLTEKLNVYEWVESGSTKSYGDSGVECNGNDERFEATPGKKRAPIPVDENDDVAIRLPTRERTGNDGEATAAVVVVANGRSDPSSTSTSDASSVKENPSFRPTDKDSAAGESSDSPPPPSLPPPLDSTTLENRNDHNSPVNAASAGLIPRVDSFHSFSSPFNGALLVGSNSPMRCSTTSNGDGRLNGVTDDDDDDDDDDDGSSLEDVDPDSREDERFEDSIASEEVTRETLLLLKQSCSSTTASSADHQDVTSPVCPVFNSVVDSTSGKLPAQSDSEEDEGDEYCDSSNDLSSSHETSPPATTAAAAAAAAEMTTTTTTTTTTSTTTPMETSEVSRVIPGPPPPHHQPSFPLLSVPQQDAVFPLQSPFSTASMCSTDSDLYATPSVVTPEDEEIRRDDCVDVEDAANLLEREVRQLVDTSLCQAERLAVQANEVLGKKAVVVNKEDLNFPLANEIRARPLNADVVERRAIIAGETFSVAEKETAAVDETLVVERETVAIEPTTIVPSVPTHSSAVLAVRPKATTLTTATTKQPSPRSRRVAPSSANGATSAAPQDKDEIHVLSDIDDVALRPSLREFDDHHQHHRARQISINSRQEEDDSSSSQSSQSSSWSPTGGSRRRRRNFDDWPIRSGDDSFKTKSGGSGKKHRDSDTTSAGGAGGGGRGGGGGGGGGVASNNVNAAPRGGRGGPWASSSRGRVTSNPPSSAGGAGGLPPPYPQQQQPIASAVNEQIAVALLRIQQDVSTLNARINTLETLFWSSRNGNGVPPGMNAAAVATAMHGGVNHNASGDCGLTPPSPASAMKPIATSILNWLFPGFSLRSVVFLLLWPILAKGAYLVVKALIGLALMKRRRFIDGHDDLPPL